MTRSARALPLLAVGAAALLLSGCGSDPAPRAAAATATPTGTPSTVCPAPRASTVTWPAGVPLDLPVPPGTELGTSSAQPDGTTVVRFSTEDSLRNGVVHLTRALGPAGFTLGRGDAEDGEADAPFTRGDLRGVFRLTDRGACRTDWLLAVTVAPDTGAPLLPAGADTDTDAAEAD